MKPKVLTSLDHPSILPYKTLRRSEDHISRRIFVAEGEKVVRRLLRSPIEIISFLVTEDWMHTLLKEEQRFGELEAEVFVASREILGEIVGYRLHQGIMAVAKVPPEADLNLLRSATSCLVVALDGLMNAENVGVIVRNCAGFGVSLIISGETSSSPYQRRSVRNSMGTVFQIPIHHSANLVSDLRSIKEYGVRVVGAHLEGSVSLESADLSGRVCIVFGNEESGLSGPVSKTCDTLVSIPMKKGTDSLNVASAAAVFLYEASRP